MPTGYTSGIIDGKVNSFAQFAKISMRAFGATIHQRDEPLDSAYKPREVSDYHKKRIEEADAEIKKLKKLKKDELEKEIKANLTTEIKFHEKEVKRKEKLAEKIKAILDDAKKWKIPTPEHLGFKEFMVRQLEETISYDTDTKYNLERIVKNKDIIEKFDADEVRKRKLEELEKSLEYHKIELKKEEETVKDSNSWVDAILKTL